MRTVPFKIVFSLVLALTLNTHVAGSDLPDAIKGFKPQTPEVYFDRADQEKTDTDWQRVAQFGTEASISEWEKNAVLLYTDPTEIARARAQLTSWVGAQMQERFQDWLVHRFFDEQGSLGITAVRQAITDANLQYLYTTDSSGNVQFDANGDPILRGVDGLRPDRQGWNATVHEAEDAVLAAWEQNVDQAFAPELGQLLGDDGLSRYQDYKIGMRDGLRREMERVALQGEISLVSRRLYDQYSLRKKSESATAEAIVDEIVRETTAQTDAGIQQIQAGLSLTPEAVDSSTPAIDVEKWQQSFQAVFESGLSRWDEAEQKFLASRMEWEQEAGISYAEGEQAWAAAFQRLRTERKSWEKQVDTLLQAGAARWDQQRTDLSAAIERARTEFQKERDQRVAALQDQVGALVDMYAQVQQVLATAQASGQALIKRMKIMVGSAYLKFSDSPATVTAIENDRRDKWSTCISEISGIVTTLSGQDSALRSQIAGMQDDLDNSRTDWVFYDEHGSGMSTTTEIEITNATTITIWITTTSGYAIDTATYTTSDPTNEHIPALISDSIKEYMQLTAEIGQAATSLAGVDSQFAYFQRLANTMSSAEAGPFLQGDRASFANARSQYEAYLRQQSPFDADVFVAEWERYSRITDWMGVLTAYNEQATETRQKLQEALGTAFGTEATDLRDVLKTDVDSGVTYLDEYQLELLRAKAIRDYWTQKKAIADAVVAYAQDLSSGRQTEEQSQKAYEAAQSAYESQLAAYNQTMAQLQAGGTDLVAARQALEAAQKAADDASARYEEARQNYLQALVATQSGNVEFYRDQIKQKYSDLLAASGMTTTDTELADATSEYFAAARRNGYDLAVKDAWGSVSELIHGDPASGMPSLESLENEAEAIRVPSSVDSIPSTVEQLGVTIDSAQFVPVSTLYSAWHEAAPGDTRDLAGWKLVGYMSLLKTQLRAAYDERLAEVKAHGAVDADAWYSEGGGHRMGSALTSRLTADSTAAQLALISARAGVEKRGLQAWLQLQSGQTPTDGNALLLARTAPSGLGQEEAAARIQALTELQDTLQGSDSDPAGAAERLRDTVEAGGWIQSFVAGKGSFEDDTAGDLVLASCLPQYEEMARADGLLSAWDAASGDTTALVAERETSALDSIKGVFGSRGFTLARGSVLPSSEAIARRLGSEADAVALVAELTVELDQASSTGPQWLQDRIREYTDSLAGYVVTVARKVDATLVSERAAAATSAATTAKASQTDLRSVIAQLYGTGRLAALVDLSTRRNPPSASAVSVQSLVVESAAIQVAKRSLADTGQTLTQIAAGLVPGLSDEISNQIVQRAIQLLQTNAGTDVTGQRIEAYRLWNTVSVNDAVSGVVVNPLASEARKLWEAVQEAGNDSTAQRGAIDEYLSGFAPGSAPQEIVNLCQALKDGVVGRDELFRAFLFGQDFDSLMSSFDSMGLGSEVYKRATVLRIASLQAGSDEGRALAGFLRDRTGIQSAEDAESFAGAGANADLSQAAMAGASDLSLEFLCKSLLLQGLPISGDLADRLPASSAQAEVSAFENMLRAARGYIPVLDESASAYITRLGGDLSTRSSLAAALSTGQWDDEFFAAAAESSYLDWRQSVVDASLDSAAQVIQDELAEKATTCAKLSYQRTTEAGYWRQVQDQADSPASWRSYLVSLNLEPDSPVATAVVAQTRDTTSYTRNTATATAAEPRPNALLEAFNELARRETAFAKQLKADAGGRAALTKFHDFLAQLTAGTATETDLPAATEQGLQAAQSRYEAALSRIQSLKKDIRRSGAALALLDLGTDARRQTLKNLKDIMDGVAGQVTVTQGAADDALDAFESSGNSYDALCAQLHASEELLAKARSALSVQQEIRDWASNGYLSANGETVDGYQSPLQSQQAAERHLVKATAALDALQGLFGNSAVSERPIRDAATLAAYESWKSSYAEMMRLEKISGELSAATAEQQDKVKDLTTDLDKARNDILDGSLAAGGIPGLTESSRLKSWGTYLVVQNGKLRLNIDSSFTLHALNSEEAIQSVKDFFKKKTNGSDATGFEQQIASFIDYVQRVAPTSDQKAALIARWGYAADWLKRQLYDNGTDDVQDMVGSVYEKDTSIVGDPKWLDYRAADEHHTEVQDEWAPEAYAIGGSQYSAIIANSEDKDAFECYLAMRAASGKEGTDLGQFHTRTYEWIMTQLVALLDQRYEHYRRLARQHGWLNSVTGAKQNRDEYNELEEEALGTLSQIQGQNTSDSDALQSTIAAFASAQGLLEDARSRLAELQGTDGKALKTFSAFIDQYNRMETELKGAPVTADADLRAQLSTAWGLLKSEDKASFSNTLQKMTRIAEARNEDAQIDVKAALAKARSDSAQAQQDYLATYNAFLEGQADERTLKDSAATAYRDSAWVARTEQELTTGVFSAQAFTLGPLTDVEMQARMVAVQQYAQSLVTACAGSLDARGAAAGQRWSQSMADLSDQRQSWYAQVGLISAKAASAWDASQQKLASAISSWRQGFQQQYAVQSDAWRASYLSFGEQKLGWVQQVAVKAAQVGNEAILSEVGASADDALRSASTPMIAALSFDPQGATLQVESLLSQVGSDEALTAIRRMNAGITDAQVMVASAQLRVDTRGARIAAEVKRFLADSREQMARLAAREIADEAQQGVVEARKALAESVKKANGGFQKSMDYTFANAGYTSSSGSYEREAIARTTFTDVITEHQKVEGYRPYAMPAVQIATDLSQSRLKGLGAEAVMDLVGIAQQEVSQAQKKIFGEGKDLTDEQKRAAGLMWDVVANDKTVTKEIGEGDFGKHIGYAPEFTDEPDFDRSRDRNIVVKGSGELGRLMGDFIWNQMKEGRGWSEMALPRWDKPLWDDTGSWFKAPSLRAVGTMGAALVAAMIPGGQGLSAVLTTAAIATTATIAFDSLDVAYGYKSWEEAGLDIGKSFLTNTVSGTIGLGFKGIGSAWSSAGETFGQIGQGVVGKTLLAGAQSFTTNVATSAISAVDLDGGWGIGFDTDAFSEGAFGKGAWVNVASSAVMAGTSTLLSGNLTGFSQQHLFDVNSVASLGGGLASSALTYGLTGEATLNVLNAADLGGPQYGLMEMHVGGDFSMNLGSSGTDVSMGAVYNATKGMGTFYEQQRFRLYDALGNVDYASNYGGSREAATLMRANYSFGDQTQKGQLERFLAGRDTLQVGYISQPGLTVANGDSRLVKLATLGQKGNISSQLAAGIVMGHEAYRNGVDDGLVGQWVETQVATARHTELALRVASQYGTDFINSSDNLTNDVGNYLKGREHFASYVSNTYGSNRDNWLLKRDGTIVDDGSADLHWEAVERGHDEYGNPTYKTVMSFAGMTKEESLVQMLGGADSAKRLLQDKGVGLTGNETPAELGRLLMGNYINPATPGALTIGYGNFQLNRNYKAIYNSFTSNRAFLSAYLPASEDRNAALNFAALTTANGGEAILNNEEGDLEYYTLLVDHYNKTPGIAGTIYMNDPVAYLLATTEVVNGHGLSSAIRINKAMTGQIVQGLDETIKAGGAIPEIGDGGGLAMRFANNNSPVLALSDHALGNAVDFDPVHNNQYFLPESDAYFESAISASLGKSLTDASGYADQKRLAELVSGFPQFLADRQASLENEISATIGLDVPSGIKAALLQEKIAELEKVRGELEGRDKYPMASFTMSQIFVNTMRNYLNWGGDWPWQKDYMHFQLRKPGK